MNLRIAAGTIVIGGSIVGAPCGASYILAPSLEAGESSVVAPGQLIKVHFSLTSPSGPLEHNSAIFRGEFSVQGLILESVLWASPYQTGTVFDDSKPNVSQLPLAVTNDLLAGFGYPPGVADFELSNVVPVGTFSTGILATVQFRVPAAFSASSFVLRARSDTIANGLDVLAVTDGPGISFIVIPGPSVWIVPAIAIMVMRRRRR
jgi:hypothetical protein